MKRVNFWVVLTFILGALLIASFFFEINFSMTPKWESKSQSPQIKGQMANPVSAEEIYPLFECPCCGKSINECTCPMAKERMAYVDGLVENKASEKEVILAFVKKYGLNSFVDENKAKEMREELVKTASSDRPIISLSPDTYDFGDVSQKEGKIFTHFDLKNEGESDLVIDRLDTSCGCTFASIVFRGEEGPLFAMAGHGYENPTDWKVSIPPGEQAQLKVVYDPDVHRDFRGPATREIYVYSNDPIDFEKTVKIELNQVE